MEILSLIFSGVAVLFTGASYLLGLRFYNQNKVFDEKLLAYGKIATAFDDAVVVITRNIERGSLLKERSPKGFEKKLGKLADEIDEVIDELFDVLMANIILLPTKLHNELNAFATFLESDENFDIFNDPKRIDLLAKDLRKRQYHAIELMRADLNSDTLNTGLHKRLTGKAGQRIFGIK